MATEKVREIMRWVYALSFFMAVVALSRFMDLPANFTPVIAAAVFLPVINRGLYFSILPVVVLFVTDLVLGFHETMLYTYGAVLLIGLFAQLVRFSLGVKALSGVLIWHLIVNYGVYLHSVPTRSLIDVYVSAWPFDFRLLVSTLLFTILFWLTKVLVERRFMTNYADR
jgi:hypothetical protein